MKNLRWGFLVGAWMSLASAGFASASAFDSATLWQILESGAGRTLARELGIELGGGTLFGSKVLALSETDARVLARAFKRVGTRYLAERPQDEWLFEPLADGVTAPELRVDQIERLRETIHAETVASPAFVRAGRSLRDAFVARALAPAAATAPSRQVDAILPALPARIDVDVNKALVSEFYEKARLGFTANFDPSRLEVLLDRIESQGAGSLSIEEKLELKGRRKEASVLRGVFITFSKPHEAPEAIQRYARDFGKFNDALEVGLEEPITDAVHALKKSLSPKKIRAVLTDHVFDPIGHDRFNEYLNSLMATIEKSLSKDVLPIERFHDLRKELKELLNLFGLSEQVAPDAAHKTAYDYLYALNEKLGLMHDEVVARAIRGEVRYEDQSIVVPQEHRAAIRELIGRIHLVD
jgi:hypothetical protein